MKHFGSGYNVLRKAIDFFLTGLEGYVFIFQKDVMTPMTPPASAS
jgi:hypothetical protein